MAFQLYLLSHIPHVSHTTLDQPTTALHWLLILTFGKANNGKRTDILKATLTGDSDMVSKCRYMMSESTYAQR